MSSVVSASPTSDVTFPDGTRLIRYEIVLEDNFTLQETVEYVPGRVPSGFDANAQAIVYGNKALANAKRSEELAIADLGAVDDPLDYTLNPRWTTSQNIARVAIYWMWQEKDPRIVLYLEPLIAYIQTNFNADQVASFLNLTAGQVQKLNRRVNAILNEPASIKSAKTLLSEYDLEEEVVE